MKRNLEERMTSKLLTFVLATDMTKWNMHVTRIVKRLKQDPNDDYDTEYVDVDQLLGMYMDWYKIYKRTHQKNLSKQFQRVISGNGEVGKGECSVDNISSIM